MICSKVLSDKELFGETNERVANGMDRTHRASKAQTKSKCSVLYAYEINK